MTATAGSVHVKVIIDPVLDKDALTAAIKEQVAAALEQAATDIRAGK